MGGWGRAGAVNTHLCKRRIQESNIFLYGDYTGTGSHPNYCYTVYDGNGVLMGSRYVGDQGISSENNGYSSA